MNGRIATLCFLVCAAATMHAAVYSLGTSTILVGPTAGSDSVVLAVSPETNGWTASTDTTWLHLADSSQGGTGSMNVIFGIDANPGTTRSGTLTIAGQILTVTQAGSTYITAQTMNTLVSSGLNQPRGVALDGAGNIYIGDTGNNAVKKWSIATHAVTTLVSSGLNSPNGVAVDGTGNVFIADTGNNAIKEWMASNSNVSTLVSSWLHSPSGVATDKSGNVYIADGYDATLFEWTVANSNVITLTSNNVVCSPPGLAVDAAGNVYFDDTCGDGLGKWTAASNDVTTLQCCWFYNPTGVAVDGAGNVYIADQADNWIWEWSAAANNNTVTTLVSGFNRPGGVAVDGSGNLYIADTDNGAIEEWSQVFMDPSPKWEGLVAGSDSLPAVLPASAQQLASFAPVSDQPWLTITGVTNGVVYFSFTTTSASRTGNITLLGQRFPVTQRAASVSLGMNQVLEGPGAGSNSVVLAVYPYTNTWVATANASWIHLDAANQSGSGSTNVIFSFDANPGATRAGTLTIAGQTLTVTQGGSTYVPAGTATLLSGTPFADGDAVDQAGNVYLAVADQNVVKTWTATNGIWTPLITSGLTYPTEVAVDNGGNVFVSDSGTIQEWTATGEFLNTVGSAGGLGLAVDSAGNAYFPGNSSIQIWTAANNIVSPLVSGINGPTGTGVDAAGNVYFAGGGGMQEWTAANNTVTLLASPPFDIENELAVDGEGNVYLSGEDSYYDSYSIMKWNAVNNTLTTVVSSGQAQYFGVAVDSAGDIYFTDAYDGLVQELPNALVDPTPKFEGVDAGHDSLPAVLPANFSLTGPFAPTNDSSWLTLTGVTNGVVSYAFTTNVSLVRTGHITLLGHAIPIIQAGIIFSVGTSNLYEGPAAGSDSVVVAVVPNFGVWTATTNVPWLHLNPANQSGTGGTNLIFSFDANPGATRSGKLTISGQTVTVTQAGSTYVAANPLTTLASSGLLLPARVAVDGAGNVYVADSAAQAIEEWVATNSTVTTLISTGLNRPGGVAVDAAGNLYIADEGNNAIYEWVAISNVLATLVSSNLNTPSDVAVDAAGNVYIADTDNDAVKEWIPTNNNVTTLVAAGLNRPQGVAVDVAGNVYIADTYNDAIKEWMPASATVTTLVSSGLNLPAGVAVDGSGNIYIADNTNNAVKAWSAVSHSVITLATSSLNSPFGVAVDGTGNVFIADTGNKAVDEIPHAFVDSSARVETANAGTGALPAVLPTTENLRGSFTPVSDQSWLTINGTTAGVVNFSFTANSGPSRTANIDLLGRSIDVTQNGPTYSLGTDSLLIGPQAGSNSVVLAVAPNTLAWTATPNATWLHLSAASQSGAGSAIVIFGYDANNGPTRSGSLTIAGQILTVTQAGATYVLAAPVVTLVSTGLSAPFGVAVGRGGKLYIADTLHNLIKEYSPTSNNTSTLVSSNLSRPNGVAVDSVGDVYIADTYHNVIKEWTASNSNVVTLVTPVLNNPDDVAADNIGNIYIADTGHNAVDEWVAANNSVVTLVSSNLNSPNGVAVDGAGNVYIADTDHNAIKEWTRAGQIISNLVSSGLSFPAGVAVDGAGNVYIADSGNNEVKEWMPANNKVTTLVSTGLGSTHTIAVDNAGNLFIADTADSAIKEVPYAFVDPTGRLEGLAAGSDQLPTVLPATADLANQFTPTSDQPWLTITGITNGVLSFAFATNAGPARLAHIHLLNQTILITQGLVGTPPSLTGVQMLGNGAIQLSFTNNPSASFTVLSSTNLSLPLSSWTVLGPATNASSSDLFQFTSSAALSNQQCFYTVRSP